MKKSNREKIYNIVIDFQSEFYAEEESQMDEENINIEDASEIHQEKNRKKSLLNIKNSLECYNNGLALRFPPVLIGLL